MTPRVLPSVPAVAAAFVLLVAACGGDDDDGGDVGGDLDSPVAVEAREIVRSAGCTACHGADGEGGIGPGWAGSFGTDIELEDGSTVTVDEAYLTTAIADPQAQVRAGFDITMPENELTDAEIATVVEYIRLLGDTAATGTTG